MRLTKLEFIGLLGPISNILAAAKVNADIELFVKMIDWATPDEDGTSIDLEDPRVGTGLYQLEAGGLLPSGTADSIMALNGGEQLVPEVPRPSVAIYLLPNQITVIREAEPEPENYIKAWPIPELAAQMLDAGTAQVRRVGDSVEVYMTLS